MCVFRFSTILGLLFIVSDLSGQYIALIVLGFHENYDYIALIAGIASL